MLHTIWCVSIRQTHAIPYSFHHSYSIRCSRTFRFHKLALRGDFFSKLCHIFTCLLLYLYSFDFWRVIFLCIGFVRILFLTFLHSPFAFYRFYSRRVDFLRCEFWPFYFSLFDFYLLDFGRVDFLRVDFLHIWLYTFWLRSSWLLLLLRTSWLSRRWLFTHLSLQLLAFI